jgi:hypothetical protein
VAIKFKSVSVGLPWKIGNVTMEVSDAAERAAWELYVEYATRVATYELEPGSGKVREALDSIHSLFGTTRAVLRAAGPDAGKGKNALGPLAIRMLNEGLRPFLVKWHVEAGPDGDLVPERRAEFDADLEQLRKELDQSIAALAKIAGAE